MSGCRGLPFRPVEVLITKPANMPAIAKLGKILGKRLEPVNLASVQHRSMHGAVTALF